MTNENTSNMVEVTSNEVILPPVTSNKEEDGVTKSPSLSSLSSIDSNSSTDKLIKSLSVHKLDNLEGELPKEHDQEGSMDGKVTEENESTKESNQEDEPPKESAEQAPPLQFAKNSKNIKKPIKFTVRKVSHEAIKSPVLKNKVSGEKGQNIETQKSYQQLKATQSKYDQYVNRINKINKEIDFLTNLLPPYNVEIDYTTRTKITRAIEKLKMKQDELEKKKYSSGITISRLWREHDDSDIWVRSVSNQ